MGYTLNPREVIIAGRVCLMEKFIDGVWILHQDGTIEQFDEQFETIDNDIELGHKFKIRQPLSQQELLDMFNWLDDFVIYKVYK